MSFGKFGAFASAGRGGTNDTRAQGPLDQSQPDLPLPSKCHVAEQKPSRGWRNAQSLVADSRHVYDGTVTLAAAAEVTTRRWLGAWTGLSVHSHSSAAGRPRGRLAREHTQVRLFAGAASQGRADRCAWQVRRCVKLTSRGAAENAQVKMVRSNQRPRREEGSSPSGSGAVLNQGGGTAGTPTTGRSHPHHGPAGSAGVGDARTALGGGWGGVGPVPFLDCEDHPKVLSRVVLRGLQDLRHCPGR